MSDQTTSRTGGQLVAECLRLHGVDTVFTVPGESFLAVLDGLHDADPEAITPKTTLSAIRETALRRGHS